MEDDQMITRVLIVLAFVLLCWAAIEASQPTLLELAARIPIPVELTGP